MPWIPQMFGPAQVFSQRAVVDSHYVCYAPMSIFIMNMSTLLGSDTHSVASWFCHLQFLFELYIVPLRDLLVGLEVLQEAIHFMCWIYNYCWSAEALWSH